MARKQYKTFICGGNYSTLQARQPCPNVLHDWPTPDGYCESFEVANARLAVGWRSARCAECGLYGWVPNANRPPSTNAVRVPAEEVNG